MQTSIPQQSVLDSKSSRVLNFPLTVEQQLWMIFLLPSITCTTFYIVDLATDLSIGLELLSENRIWAGVITLLIVYAAPLISYIMQLRNLPAENKFKPICQWFLTETAAFIFFPLRPIQCFGERLFWAIEALRTEDPKREEALIAFEQTRTFTVENYLFIQGIIHAAPQALFQLSLLILGTSPNTHTELMQAFGIITSLFSLAVVTTSYHRYETQAKGGRKRIWLKARDFTDSDEPRVLLVSPGQPEPFPRRTSWVKVMDEDNPVGKLFAFLFWFFFLLGRCLCLVMAAVFFPWAVLGVCAAHYIFTLIYILPSPDCKSKTINKILLSFVYILCLVEVGIRFRKSYLFNGLFIIFSIVENFSLTLLWVLWAKWHGWWYMYTIYLMGITHIMALVFLFTYLKYFKPPIRRIQPNIR